MDRHRAPPGDAGRRGDGTDGGSHPGRPGPEGSDFLGRGTGPDERSRIFQLETRQWAARANSPESGEVMAVERGCGEREEGGIYMVTPLTSGPGRPVEDFLVCPPQE